MEKERTFLERVKLQTIGRLRNEAVLALEDLVERDLNPKTREEDFDATRRRLLFGIMGAFAVGPVLAYKEPPTSKVLEQGRHYEFKRQFYFFNEAYGVKLRINIKNLKHLLRDPNIDITLPQNTPFVTVFRPMELNQEGENLFAKYLTEYVFKRLNYPHRETDPILYFYLDQAIRDELKENPTSRLEPSSLSRRVSLEWVKYAHSAAHGGYGRSPKTIPELTQNKIQEIKNNHPIEVLSVESSYVDNVVKRYFVAPEVKVGPEIQLNQPQMILKEGNGAPIRNGIIFSTIAGLELSVLSFESSQLIREWENNGIAVPSNSLVVTILGPSNGQPDMNSLVLDDFRKNQLSKLLTRYNPDAPHTLKLIPVYEAINNVVGYETITNKPDAPLNYSRLSVELSLAWAKLFYETAALAKGKQKEELELSPEDKRRVVELLPLRVISVDQSLRKKALESAPKG